MRFETALVLGIITLCLGGVLGSLICVCAGAFLRKQVSKSHFTVICILMSAAVAAGAAGFVLINNISQQLSLSFSYLPFFCALFVSGALCTVFAKIAVPFFLSIYIVLSVLTGVSLYSRFGSLPDSVSVTLNKNSVNAGNKSFAVDSPHNKKLVVEVYTLPGVLLLPLPRVWYSVIGTVDSDFVIDNTEEIRLAAAFSGDGPSFAVAEENPESSFFWRRQYRSYRNWFLKDRIYLPVPVPKDSVLPSVYTLKFIANGEDLTCRLEKNL